MDVMYKNAYVLNEEELWSLQKYGVRYVVDGDCGAVAQAAIRSSLD